ncbi:PREDICTED: F-box protein At1g30790-like isoform X1 [Tarenaya hassleriana]|uniref:F-box protein At1g30790-like isoform X1 n=1 Tax=Tarenaya hassleriana TaxID=28532 RepID=UPI00053C3E57|nr:PREDICTED: F-box protein At1g30790-like isoform X1 [Tarenaya hassleriana]
MSKETATGHSGQPPWQKPLPHTTDMPTESPPGNSPFGLFSISLSKILTKLVAIFRIMSILLGKKKMTEICRTKLNQNSQTCSVRNRGESEDVSNPIITPDLTFEILSRLPAKTLVRSQCVSKDWSSIIHSPHFANSFLARSSTRPRLLVAFPDTKRRHSVLYSSPHPENHGHDSILVASHEMTIPLCLRFTQSIHGLFCSQNAHELSICNPATKKFVTLPEIGSKKTLMYSFFGYDHVSHQYKVLSITHNPNYDQVVREESDTEHWVFTLSSSQKEWRKIKGIRSEYPSCGLCINGVLYYGASRFTRNPPIVRFDVRTENFDLIKPPKESHIDFFSRSTLIDHDGKLAIISYHTFGVTFGFEFYVLEDVGKEEEWSKKAYVSPSYGDLQWETTLCFLGASKHTKEIVLVRRYDEETESESLYIFYYDWERNNIRRVEIKGNEEFRRLSRQVGSFCNAIMLFPDLSESIMFL